MPDEEAIATSLYGVIVSSAVIATSRADRVAVIALSVMATLLVYWAAERYSRLVAERIHDGRRPSWHQVRLQLTRGWEMVTASVLPLVTLLLARLMGAGPPGAAMTALVCSTVLLGLAGWRIGRQGELTVGERIVSTVVAGGFGIGMIVLKTLLH